MTEAIANNGSTYWVIQKQYIVKARTLQEVKDEMNKRVNYSESSNMRLPEGIYEILFNGSAYYLTIKKETCTK